MRRARWLVLLLITVIVASLVMVWKAQKITRARNAPKRPASLPVSVSARAYDWAWEKTKDGRPIVRVWAGDQRVNANGDHLELERVELHLFHKDGKAYDQVRSAKANFSLGDKQLFSDGDVEITMAVPIEPNTVPLGRLVVINTSGVHFDTTSGKAYTDRPARFHFDRGEGQSVGAQYDPATRELLMHNQVQLTWRGDDPKKKPMDIESGSLIYKEAESKVFLTPWSKFRRDTLAMEGGNAVVFLKDGAIEAVEAGSAKGVDTRPGRVVQYGADQLNIYFDERGALKNVAGNGNANLLSTTPTSKTNVNSGRLDLEFEPTADDSVLRKSIATTQAVVRSEPIVQAAVPPPDTRVLRSEVIVLYMRPNGEEMERVETQSPGTAEFIPNRAGQKHRIVKAERMNVEYGPDNQIKTFTGTLASTQTDNEPVKGKPQPPSLTWSNGIAAHFDVNTGNMSLLEQWDNFRYEEGDRRAKSDRAELAQAIDEMKLIGSARMWDPSGSTAADTIAMKQKSGDFVATGNVNSTRQPEAKKENRNSMMSGDEPVQARALKMTSAGDNSLITYTGEALLWQGSNRITADTIHIDRKNSVLEASGTVNTQLLDKKETSEKKAKTPIFTNVQAPEMRYDDKARLAHYKGGSTLVRSGTTVTGKEIRAWLKQGEDSSLDHAFSDGNVKIVQVTPERTRTGTAEHSEYYVDGGKVILSEGAPVFVDSVKGVTRGRKITYFADNDRLFVEGEEKKPAESRIRRTKP